MDPWAKLPTGLVLQQFAILVDLHTTLSPRGAAAGLNRQPFTGSQIPSGTPSRGLLFCFVGLTGFKVSAIRSEGAGNPAVKVPKAIPFTTADLALATVNDHGPTLGIRTGNLSRACRMIRDIKTRVVM